jgi:hypothetical protein
MLAVKSTPDLGLARVPMDFGARQLAASVLARAARCRLGKGDLSGVSQQQALAHKRRRQP